MWALVLLSGKIYDLDRAMQLTHSAYDHGSTRIKSVLAVMNQLQKVE